MSDSAGTNRDTGAVLTDWDHVEQSIKVILTTRLGSRVMRRDFGSALPELVDRKMTPSNILAIYAAAALAVMAWEPRYRVTSACLDSAEHNGRVALTLNGTYFPHGHLGDYSITEAASVRAMVAT